MQACALIDRLRPAVLACSGKALCLAYSGGLDSTVLLHLLARLAPEAGFLLSAVHVHHGLSAQADAWAAHCETVCAKLGVGLRVERVKVLRDAGRGVEAAARDARHAVLARCPADWILLAHHADDQAETLLHRLMRGAGVIGAAAMRERDDARRLWRPLLGVTRTELEAWAQAEKLEWIEDDSNPDQRFTRNFLRHAVLGPLTERLPAASRNLARAAGHFAEAADLLRDLAQIDAQSIVLAAEGSRTGFSALSEARRRNVLRYWLDQAGLLAVDALRLENLLQRVQSQAEVREVLGPKALCAYRSRLWIESQAASGQAASQLWRGESILKWQEGCVRFTPAEGPEAVRLDPAQEFLELRTRQGGEHLRLGADRPQRTLKALCQEAGLPQWWREQLPLLWRGEALLWVGGVGPAASVRCAPGEFGWRIEWCGPDGLWR